MDDVVGSQDVSLDEFAWVAFTLGNDLQGGGMDDSVHTPHSHGKAFPITNVAKVKSHTIVLDVGSGMPLLLLVTAVDHNAFEGRICEKKRDQPTAKTACPSSDHDPFWVGMTVASI